MPLEDYAYKSIEFRSRLVGVFGIRTWEFERLHVRSVLKEAGTDRTTASAVLRF